MKELEKQMEKEQKKKEMWMKRLVIKDRLEKKEQMKRNELDLLDKR